MFQRIWVNGLPTGWGSCPQPTGPSSLHYASALFTFLPHTAVLTFECLCVSVCVAAATGAQLSTHFFLDTHLEQMLEVAEEWQPFSSHTTPPQPPLPLIPSALQQPPGVEREVTLTASWQCGRLKLSYTPTFPTTECWSQSISCGATHAIVGVTLHRPVLARVGWGAIELWRDLWKEAAGPGAVFAWVAGCADCLKRFSLIEFASAAKYLSVIFKPALQHPVLM